MVHRRRFALLIEGDQLHMAFLASLWNHKFARRFDMSLVVHETGCPDRAGRRTFHERHRGRRYFNHSEIEELGAFYSGISEAEKDMLARSGLTDGPPDYFPRVFHVSDLNGPEMRDWVMGSEVTCDEFWFFIFLDTVLAPWWVALPHTQIVNAHSAVLPYARGMYALEQLSLVGTRTEFEMAAGATVHYIDAGIDTGPIIKATRIREPFRYRSLAAVKAACYELAFQLLAAVAHEVIANTEHKPAGMVPDRVGPLFKRKDFTPERARLARERWLAMKSSQADAFVRPIKRNTSRQLASNLRQA